MYEIRTENVYEDFRRINKCLNLAIILLSQNIMMILTNLVVGKVKDETCGIAIKEFVRLKLKMSSCLVDDNSKHKKAKGVNKNVVEKIIMNMLCCIRNV